MNRDPQKRQAAQQAAELVEDGMVVGLGTGSTAAWFVRALAARGLKIHGVPTSEGTAALARELGIPLLTLDEAKAIDLTVDGADEIGPGLDLIKGGGAALLREKLVWEASRRCVVIADAAKQVKTLGKFPLPIEVVALGHKTTALRVCDVLLDRQLAVHLHGKGRRERVIPLWKSTARELRTWLQEIDNDPGAPVFPNRAGKPLARSGVRDRLDHPVPEMTLQFAQPHQVRKPGARQHAPVPADHGRGRHHRPAEQRQLAR